MEFYDESVDYKKLHIDWLKSNTTFKPKNGWLDIYPSYEKQMLAMYYDEDPIIKHNKTAFIYLRDDVNWLKKGRKDINDTVNKMFGYTFIESDPKFFVTFNFAADKWNPQVAIRAVAKLFEKSWLTSAYGVFEFHGSNGNHPHLMMKMEVNKYGKMGKLKDKLKEVTLTTQLTGGINFVDIKVYSKYHDDYLALDKAIEKKEQLEKDVIWRGEQGLPAFVEKKQNI